MNGKKGFSEVGCEVVWMTRYYHDCPDIPEKESNIVVVVGWSGGGGDGTGIGIDALMDRA